MGDERRNGRALTYRTVVAELVEDYLRAGWMIVLPSRAHTSAMRTGGCRSCGSVSVSRDDRGDVAKLDGWEFPPAEKPKALRRRRGANYGGVDGTREAP